MSGMEYRLIQFSRNPMREEGRNIGVLAFDGSWAGFKSVGMVDGLDRPDLSRFSSILKDGYENLWVFGEWIEWFKALCVESDGNHHIIHEELDALESISPHFRATKGGYYEMDGERQETALEDLFSELVGQPSGGPKPSLRETIYQIMIRAEVTYRPEFEEDVEITIQSDEGQSSLVFTLDYFLGAEKRVGFKIIHFKNARTATLDAKVNDAIYTLSEAQKRGFLDKKRCVVLCDTPSAKRAAYIDRLQSVATVIDISKHRAYWDITTICT